jgi:hypothetical protein
MVTAALVIGVSILLADIAAKRNRYDVAVIVLLLGFVAAYSIFSALVRGAVIY